MTGTICIDSSVIRVECRIVERYRAVFRYVRHGVNRPGDHSFTGTESPWISTVAWMARRDEGDFTGAGRMPVAFTDHTELAG